MVGTRTPGAHARGGQRGADAVLLECHLEMIERRRVLEVVPLEESIDDGPGELEAALAPEHGDRLLGADRAQVDATVRFGWSGRRGGPVQLEQRLGEFFHPEAGLGCHPQRAREARTRFGGEVRFRDHDQLRPFSRLGPGAGHEFSKLSELGCGRRLRTVHDEEHRPSPGEVTQETRSGRDLEQGDGLAVASKDDTGFGFNRRERVGRDLRPGVGECAEQRRSTGVGGSHDRDIRLESQFEPKGPLLAGLAGAGDGGGSIDSAGPAHVARTAGTTRGGDGGGAGGGQVSDQFAGVVIEHDCPDRDQDSDVRTLATALATTRPRDSIIGTPDLAAQKVHEAGNGFLGDEKDGPAAAPVTAVGTAVRFERLRHEGRRSPGPTTRADTQGGAIYE